MSTPVLPVPAAPALITDRVLVSPVIGLCALLVVLVALVVLRPILNIYLQAMLVGARVPMLRLIRMRHRGADLRTVVYSHIRAVKAGLEIPLDELEAHHLRGGRVPNIVSAMLTARKAGFTLPWAAATEADLAGHDPIMGVNALVASADARPEDLLAARALSEAMRARGVDVPRLREPARPPG